MAWWWLGLGVLVVLVAALWRPARRLWWAIRAERARELFHLQREILEAKFLEFARQAGTPKGATWGEADFESDLELARHTRSGELVAFVEVTIRFIPSVSEDSDVIGTSRQATAIFHYHHGQWGTSGRLLFDMTPEESLAHFAKEYEPVG